MGYRNVQLLMRQLPPITDIPATTWRCLALMADLAHDETQQYWAGLAHLQIHLGYAPGPGGRANVMRHLRILQDAGYVEATAKKDKGRKLYQLHLPPMLPPSSTGHDGW